MTNKTATALINAETVLADMFGANLITASDLKKVDGIPSLETLKKYGLLYKVWEEAFDKDAVNEDGVYSTFTAVRYYYRLRPVAVEVVNGLFAD